jgi:DNA-binding NtrC family response regulator
LAARAIYQHSRRAESPLLVVNCAAIPEALLESELFGHQRGAFTGAASRRIGRFEQAQGGTIFLDEIGDVPLAVQAKLLRVLQERYVERLGGSEPIPLNVRVLAATSRNLEEEIARGSFREDLYYRLNVVTVALPALRDRRDDIPRLTDYFLDRFSQELGIGRPLLAEDALNVLGSHAWPGNVRELEHCIYRALLLTRGYPISAPDVLRALQASPDALLADHALVPPGEGGVPAEARTAGDLAERGGSEERSQPGLPAFAAGTGWLSLIRQHLDANAGPGAHERLLELVDRLLVAEALKRTHGNQTHAARLLGLPRPTLHAKLRKYGLGPGR